MNKITALELHTILVLYQTRSFTLSGKVLHKVPTAVSYTLNTLEKRLRGRSTETEEQLAVRLDAAIGEMKRASEYDYVVVNKDAGVAAEEIASIIRAEKCSARRNKYFLENLIYGGNSGYDD